MRNEKRNGTEPLSDLIKPKEIPSPCHSGKIALWLVLLDNVPTLLLFILGFLIISRLTLTGAILYGVYALFSIAWFWAKICPYCHHHGTLACPCGYGYISGRLFRKRKNLSFRQAFMRNIGVQFPNWFVPFGIAVYLLITRYSTVLLILTALFSVIGFAVIPLISKLAGCKNCAIKDDCPWMIMSKKEKGKASLPGIQQDHLQG